jgi:hypothetical protein
MDRRHAIGAGLLGLGSASAFAGPLNPPPGPIGPSGPSLADIAAALSSGSQYRAVLYASSAQGDLTETGLVGGHEVLRAGFYAGGTLGIVGTSTVTISWMEYQQQGEGGYGVAVVLQKGRGLIRLLRTIDVAQNCSIKYYKKDSSGAWNAYFEFELSSTKFCVAPGGPLTTGQFATGGNLSYPQEPHLELVTFRYAGGTWKYRSLPDGDSVAIRWA